MKLSLQTLASLLTVPSALALATPSIPPSTVNSTTNGTITPPSRYYLQTRVKDHGSSDKNGLYVSTYHTGAGFNDATLGSIEIAAAGFLNETYQQFDLGDPFPWGMNIAGNVDDGAWDFVQINVGLGSSGFFFNESGLQVNDLVGWLACDWWHGVPQLFWRTGFSDTSPYPSSCAEVDLLPIAIPQ
ncbi:MAG: hypothetical protein ASARMPRED_000070 [Alectoria sarmentosa]|nr:MAG: hypothetical protein ASARMPRED_000070 [Alectoria sarmentosa]